MTRTKKAAVAGAVVAATVLFSASSCTEGEPKAQKAENSIRQESYDYLTEKQPSKTMKYSPTRATKNFWVTTWDEKGKLSYVYLLNGEGQAFGYYVFEGLPVSYCTSLVPPVREYKIEGDSSGQVGALGPGPSVDGTFSSSANCNVFYGKDATSGAYMEYTTGMGINALVYSEPMSVHGAAKPLGDAKVKQ